MVGFVGLGFGPRSARLRMDSALGRRIYACPVGFTSDCCDFSRKFLRDFSGVSFGPEVFDSYSRIR
jgi:hypothetical protein